MGRIFSAWERNGYKVWLETLKERDHPEEVGLHGRIILKFVLK
jgi:hypothetical protein